MTKTRPRNIKADPGFDLSVDAPLHLAVEFLERLSREPCENQKIQAWLGDVARALGLVSLMLSVQETEELRGAQLGWAIEEYPPDGVEPERIILRNGGAEVGVVEACPDWERGPLTPQEIKALEVIGERLVNQLRTGAMRDALTAGALEVEAIQTVSREMTWGSDIDALMAVVVREAVRITGGEGGGLYLLDRGEGELELTARVGTLAEGAKDRIPLGYGIAGWAAQSGTPLRVSDRGAQGEPQAGPRRSQLAVPLVSDGRVTGALSLESSGADRFTATHERTLSIFAAQAAKAIEAARLILALRKERDLRDNIVGGTPNGVVALDHQRRVVLMNQSARRLLRVEESPEGNVVERYLPQTVFLEGLSRVLDGQTELENLEFIHGAGERARTFLVNFFALGRGAGRGATFILQDLTERKELDERVQRMDRMVSIGQLAAGIAHEIRNPLTGIGITLDILREEGLRDEANELINDIVREIDRLEALIREVLDFARPQPAQRRLMRLAKALEWHRTFDSQCREKEVNFRLEMEANPKIEGDPKKLKQLFLNLALNGLEATEPGGTVEIACSETKSPDGGRARVVVSDTGNGMDEETAAQIFNPFFTKKNEGTGLGLSIAYSIVEQHDGQMDVESQPGKGSRFIVELPLRETAERGKDK